MAIKSGFHFPRKFGFGISAGDIPVRAHVRRKAKGGFVPHGKKAHAAVVTEMVDPKCIKKPVRMAKGGMLPADADEAGQAALAVLKQAAMPDAPTSSEQSLVKQRPMPAAGPAPLSAPAPTFPTLMGKRIGPVAPLSNGMNPLIKSRM